MVRTLMRLLCCFFSLASMAMDGTHAQSLFKRSLSLYQKGQFSSARSGFQSLVREFPESALYWFNLGTSQFMLGKFKDAHDSFVRVESLGSPLQPVARYYQAKSLMELGDREGAWQLLDTLRKSTQLPQHLRRMVQTEWRDLTVWKALIFIRQKRFEEAQKFIAQGGGVRSDELLLSMSDFLKRRVSEGRSELKGIYIEAALGQDSNAYGDSSSASSTLGSLDFAFRQNWASGSQQEQTFSYAMHWQEWSLDEELRILNQELRLNWSKRAESGVWAVAPSLSYAIWGDRSVQFGQGVHLRWSQEDEWGEWGDWGIEGETTWSRALDSDLNYLQGRYQNLRLYKGRLAFPVYGRVYLQVERQAVGDQTYSSGEFVPMSHKAWGLGIELVWSLGRKWILDGFVQHNWETYDHLARPSFRFREDRELDMRLRLTHILRPELSLRLSALDTVNVSTLGGTLGNDENFERYQVMLGVVWEPR